MAAVEVDDGASEIFAALVRAGVADSVVVYDASGRVRYPSRAPLQASEPTPESAEWLGAQQLEFESAEYVQAAQAYAAIANSARNPDVAARALQAQARCLVKAGRREAALEILTGTLDAPQYRDATDDQGSVIVPSGQLLALQLIADPSRAEYRETAERLAERLRDYSESSLSASQRRFLMEELQAIAPEDVAFPTLLAEQLVADYLESETQPGTASRLLPTELAAVWQLASQEKTVVGIFREDRLRSDLGSVIASEFTVPDATIAVVPPGASRSEPSPVLAAGAGSYLPNWQLALSLNGPDPFAVAAGRQVTVYLWTGILVQGLIAILAALVARYVSAQIRLARLKNDLVATVSHELKTPLASIRALVDTLLEGRYRDQHQREEYLRLVTKENQRLSHLIDNFLAFSRMERHKRTFALDEVKVDTIVTDALDAMRERFDVAGCHLEVNIAPDLPPVTGDADALATVLVNLLDNAYKYSGSEKHVLVRASANNGTVCLQVEDNGIGLSRRAVKKVFDRFYQVDHTLARSAGGCGLGLSIVQFIVSAHGGSVDVASQPGKGSTFTVRLPVAKGATATPEARA